MSKTTKTIRAMALCLAAFLPTSLAAQGAKQTPAPKGNAKAPLAQPAPKAEGDVYAVNYSDGRWRYFKNGTETQRFDTDRLSAGARCLVGADTYAGAKDGDRIAIEKNGVVLYALTDGTRDARVNSVAVVGADVFAGGWEHSEEGRRMASVWKNDKLLHRLTDGKTEAGVSSLFIAGGDVYAGGRELDEKGKRVAAVWKNGATLHRLAAEDADTSVFSVYVSGQDVYTGGVEINKEGRGVATIWKNGKALHRMTDGKTEVNVRSICVAGEDVYALGFEGETTVSGAATVWKNGKALYRLNDLDSIFAAQAIFVK